MKVYYTFGTNPQFPYQRGWVEIVAGDIDEAHEKFRARFPNTSPDTLNCSFFYPEDRFVETQMHIDGNFGVFCHEVIE